MGPYIVFSKLFHCLPILSPSIDIETKHSVKLTATEMRHTDNTCSWLAKHGHVMEMGGYKNSVFLEWKIKALFVGDPKIFSGGGVCGEAA